MIGPWPTSCQRDGSWVTGGEAAGLGAGVRYVDEGATATLQRSTEDGAR